MDYIPSAQDPARRLPVRIGPRVQVAAGQLPALASVHNRNDADISQVQGYKRGASATVVYPSSSDLADVGACAGLTSTLTALGGVAEDDRKGLYRRTVPRWRSADHGM